MDRALGRLLRQSCQILTLARSAQIEVVGAGVNANRQLAQSVSLHGSQFQQLAGFSAYKKPPSSEDEVDAREDAKDFGRKGHLPRLPTSNLRHRVSSDQITESLEQQDAAHTERQERIQQLLRSTTPTASSTGAAEFITEFFGNIPAQSAAASSSLDESEDAFDSLEITTPDALSQEEEGELLTELRGLRKGSQRIVLQRLLQGGMLRADPEAMAEWEEVQKAFKPPENFRMKVVDVNRTCKGTRAGGLYRFSCMVVVGNGEGVLGWGQGKAAEVNAAVKKGYMRACRNLYPIPRFNNHTIPERTEAKFGKVKLLMYPKAAGNGIVASALVAEICKMAGIHDIGVKVHGSRNAKNTVKCLFEAFDQMRTHEEITAAGDEDKVYVVSSPGKFGKLKV